jgi:hypothetical protein
VPWFLLLLPDGETESGLTLLGLIDDFKPVNYATALAQCVVSTKIKH